MTFSIKTKILLLSILWLNVNVCADGIYVLNTSLNQPKAIEKKLAQKFEGFNIKVFSRFVDLKSMIKKSKPSLIIAPFETLTALGYKDKITLKGLYNKKTKQNQFIVYMDSTLTPSTSKELKIGVLNIAGRTHMKKLISNNISPNFKIKTATKLEDLIPMLTFKTAHCILVNQLQLIRLKQRTKSILHETPILKYKLGTTSIALVSDKADDITKKMITILKSLTKEDLLILGVQAWK